MDWNAVGAVGQWVAAAATFSAVIVALWQARMARLATLPKIKVRAGHAITKIGDKFVDLIYFEAVNDGQRTVRLDMLELILPDERRLVMQEAIREFPRRLEEGEKVEVCKPTLELASALVKEGFKAEIPLRVCFRDSASREFCQVWHFDAAGWLKSFQEMP